MAHRDSLKVRELVNVPRHWLLCGFAVFLVGLLFISHRDRRTGITADAEITVPQEVVLPDISPLNLNTATADELAELPGIGPELAKRILAYREAHGGFSTVEELMEVSGIGEGKLAALDGRITAEKGIAE